MVRNSVRQQQALRRARECQRGRDARGIDVPDEVRRQAALTNERLTETERRRLAATVCGWCGGPIEIKARGRIPKWCSRSCRQRAWEQSRAAASGRAAVEVVERRVEVPVRANPAVVAAPKPRHGEWTSMLSELAMQLDVGEIYDRDLSELTVALNQLLDAFARRPYVRRQASARMS